jgi:hypothetical protein
MSYSKDGYPTELANKIGHLKLVQDPMVQRMIEAFEDFRPQSLPAVSPTATVDLTIQSPITQVITVDGGHQVVPNRLRPERQIGFVQVASQLLRIETIDFLRSNPMLDPRRTQKLLNADVHHVLAALPIVGVHIPGQSLRQSLRDAIHRFLVHYDLYHALAYLVYWQWLAKPPAPPSMDCLGCGFTMELPHGSTAFDCPLCSEHHRLSDYLGLCEQDAEDRSTAETVSNFRAALEALVLFSFIIQFRDHTPIMERTLFLLDGPLLLRAQLSRLVPPIRGLIKDQHARGLPLYLIGAEKSGEFADFALSTSRTLNQPGQFFLPSTRFIVEEVSGKTFEANTYRNRSNYGAKVVLRSGEDHTLALNVPTGDYLLNPAPNDLIGFEAIARALVPLLSYGHENALIPIVLANSVASISNQPSGSLLAQFVDRILHATH